MKHRVRERLKRYYTSIKDFAELRGVVPVDSLKRYQLQNDDSNSEDRDEGINTKEQEKNVKSSRPGSKRTSRCPKNLMTIKILY